MSDREGPSSERPSHGTGRFPDPFAPSAENPAAGADGSSPPAPAPGDQDLPWKATAERRDLWGPVRRPLEGTVHIPASNTVDRPRRGPLMRFGAPVVLGALGALAALVVLLGTGLAGPLVALIAAAGVGVVTLGGVGLAVSSPRRLPPESPRVSASAPEGTRAVLERILVAVSTTREHAAQARPRASVPSATRMLDDMESLLTRIVALVGTEQLRSLRPSSAELTMLEGIATRYLPELMDAAGDTLGFLQTFAGSAREEALANLESIDQQVGVLSEGVEQIESDIVGGVSRSLEVHSEFLRTRFADQHLNPIIDV